jgi:hypothetical protein
MRVECIQGPSKKEQVLSIVGPFLVRQELEFHLLQNSQKFLTPTSKRREKTFLPLFYKVDTFKHQDGSQRRRRQQTG